MVIGRLFLYGAQNARWMEGAIYNTDRLSPAGGVGPSPAGGGGTTIAAVIADTVLQTLAAIQQ